MANEAVFKYGSTVTLTSSGGLTNTVNLSAPAGTTYTQSNTLDYPDAVFTLQTNGFSAGYTAGTTIDIYIRPLDIVDNTQDQVAPGTGASTTAYRGVYIASFVMSGNTAANEYYRCVGYDIPRAGEVYLFNNTSANMTAGWQLKMTPRTIGPA